MQVDVASLACAGTHGPQPSSCTKVMKGLFRRENDYGTHRNDMHDTCMMHARYMGYVSYRNPRHPQPSHD